jgi:demethylmenaquinone methyltransferase/2-methoxy-6-polyprenyl-1,4-benzoquinol methylase
MSELSGNDRTNFVRQMFARLARHYDLANRWMTWGQDVKWRREVILRAHLPVGGKLLDIGTGTGDLALEALRRDKQLLVVGADFTPEMMEVGRNRRDGKSVLWINTDALSLPHRSESFDAVVSGYLLRNLVDVERALTEQYRVLKPDGLLVCLDTTPPPKDLWHLPVRLYLQLVIPIIGGWVAGDIKTYRYLPESTNHFVRAPELAECMCKIGLREVGFRSFMGGSMAIHWGTR